MNPTSPVPRNVSRAPSVIACVDTSPQSRDVATDAAALAAWLERPLVLFHAAECSASPSEPPDPLDWQLHRREGLQHLSQLNYGLSDLWQPVSLELAEGDWLCAVGARAEPASALLVFGASRAAEPGRSAGRVAARLIETGVGSLFIVPCGRTPLATHAPRIMIPVDGSQFAEVALEAAVAIARSSKAELLLVHIVARAGIGEFGPPATGDTELRLQLDRRNELSACGFLERTVRRLTDQGISARSRCLKGEPRSLLHQLVKEEKPDIVMLSARGQGRKSGADLAMGSTATYLVDHLEAPVMIVGASMIARGEDNRGVVAGSRVDAVPSPLRSPLSVV